MLFALALLAATDPDAAHALDRIEVSAARVRGVQAFDLPASVSRVDLRAAHQGAGTTIASALGGIPGLAARDRQNHAQDTQLSVRGFGARSTFGVRGLRIYIDGIPATMPDGQGQVSHFALATARRVDVLRGPFSALHGNSSGGVIELWSDDDADPEFGAQFGAGRDASLTVRPPTGAGETKRAAITYPPRSGAATAFVTTARRGVPGMAQAGMPQSVTTVGSHCASSTSMRPRRRTHSA
ncbi:MAG: Plug domain-containing protein [Chiayiivirga sp.]|jgi:iron complex outermembrane receptor protein|nr:Plug domain-containing protein [Chiayiivirga sp.]